LHGQVRPSTQRRRGEFRLNFADAKVGERSFLDPDQEPSKDMGILGILPAR
jgi:hypothetical protein